MKDIDQQIRRALNAEEAQQFDDYGELGLHEMVLQSFKGKSRWLVALAFSYLAIFMGLMIFMGYQFFVAATQRGMIGWAVGFVSCLLVTCMIKVWYWMELNKNAVTREVKRLELQVARLSRSRSNLE